MKKIELFLSEKDVYRMTSENRIQNYNHFYIKKSKGKKRPIFFPKELVRLTQTRIKRLCLDDYRLLPAVMSYRKKIIINNEVYRYNAIENAKMHLYSNYILKLDIKNFFENISFWDVKKIFDEMGFENKVAITLANICTLYDDNRKKTFLPQGAVTSPSISNIVMKKFDSQISRYCNKREIIYTRYSDDICFSSNNKKQLLLAEQRCRKLLENMNFKLKKNKRRFYDLSLNNSVAKITGIVIKNNELFPTRKVLRNYRVAIFQYLTSRNSGNEELLLEKKQKLKGYICYFYTISTDSGNQAITLLKEYIKKFHLEENEIIDKLGIKKIIEKGR